MPFQANILEAKKTKNIILNFHNHLFNIIWNKKKGKLQIIRVFSKNITNNLMMINRKQIKIKNFNKKLN